MATLYFSKDTLRVSLKSKTVCIVSKGNDNDESHIEIKRIHLHDIDRVVVAAMPAISTPVLMAFLDAGIPVFFVSSRGMWRGSLLPDNNPNSARRIRQYECSEDNDFSLRISKALICAKLKNSKRVLQRLASNRQLTDDRDYLECCKELKNLADKVEKEECYLDIVRGYEGIGAAIYFNQLSRFFPKTMPFVHRDRRPPKDAANALLSWTYTILLGELETALRIHGLDVGIGNMHRDRTRASSLALDLMEPLRPAIADLLVLNIANHGILNSKDHFYSDNENGGVYLNQEGRSAFFTAYDLAMNRRFVSLENHHETDYRRVIENQVIQYIRALEQAKEPEFFILH